MNEFKAWFSLLEVNSNKQPAYCRQKTSADVQWLSTGPFITSGSWDFLSRGGVGRSGEVGRTGRVFHRHCQPEARRTPRLVWEQILQWNSSWWAVLYFLWHSCQGFAYNACTTYVSVCSASNSASCRCSEGRRDVSCSWTPPATVEDLDGVLGFGLCFFLASSFHKRLGKELVDEKFLSPPPSQPHCLKNK